MFASRLLTGFTLAILGSSTLSGCAFGTHEHVSRASREAVPPALNAQTTNVPFDTPHYFVHRGRYYVLQIQPDSSGQQALLAEVGSRLISSQLAAWQSNPETKILYRGAYRNPLPVHLPGGVAYLQIENDERVWLLNRRQQPLSCHPYRSLRRNLFSVPRR